MKLRHATAAALATIAVACTGVIPEPDQQPPEPQLSPAPATLKRLTRTQYANAIYDLISPDIAVPIALEPDVETDGLKAIGAGTATVSNRGAEQYERAAYDIAEQTVSSKPLRDGVVPCNPTSTDDAECLKRFVEDFGARAWRRPLTQDEVQRYVTVGVQAATELDSFDGGVEFALAGLLQSPHFLFRVEVGKPDAGKPGLRKYSAFELASRLSFFLWNTIPDDALRKAAESGEISTASGLAKQTDRLLASPRARAAVRNLFTELYGLHKLDDLVKDGEIFRSMSADLGGFAREQTLLTLEDLIFEQRGDFRELFTSRRTFVNRKLASLYGIPAPKLEGFADTELPKNSARVGLLGHASVLALHAHPVSTSATLRGKFVRTVLLCGDIPPPPANVDTSLPEPSGARPTLRDRITEHLTNPSCSNCHNTMDPIGLGLENFDGIGQYRVRENGERIDASGDLDGTPFRNAKELGEAIASHPNLSQCVARNVFRYANGRVETLVERATIKALAAEFEYSDFDLVTLLRAVALNDSFRYAAQETP